MSHVTEVKTEFKSLDDLKTACETLGLELREGQRTYAWWGTYMGDSRDYGEQLPKDMGTCDHAIRIKGDAEPRNGSSGPWEIGVIAKPDGSYRLYYDTYGGAGQRLTAKVGHNAGTLKKEYAVAVATRKVSATLARKGWRLQREDLPTGAVRLKVKKR